MCKYLLIFKKIVNVFNINRYLVPTFTFKQKPTPINHHCEHTTLNPTKMGREKNLKQDIIWHRWK